MRPLTLHRTASKNVISVLTCCGIQSRDYKKRVVHIECKHSYSYCVYPNCRRATLNMYRAIQPNQLWGPVCRYPMSPPLRASCGARPSLPFSHILLFSLLPSSPSWLPVLGPHPLPRSGGSSAVVSAQLLTTLCLKWGICSVCSV